MYSSIFVLVVSFATLTLFAVPNITHALQEREQSDNVTCMAMATFVEYAEDDVVWCDKNLEAQRSVMCECTDYIEENSKRSIPSQVSEFIAKQFLLALKRGRPRKASLQEECCMEGCAIHEVHEHCRKHPGAGIYEDV